MSKLKTNNLFLISQSWGHRANCCLQNGRDGQAATENHNVPAHRPTSGNLWGNQDCGRKTGTVLEELVEAQCGQIWELKTKQNKKTNPLGPCLRAKYPHFCEFSSGTLPDSHSEDWRKKSPCASNRGRRKVATVFCSLASLSSREPTVWEPDLLGFYQSQTDLGEGQIPNSSPL